MKPIEKKQIKGLVPKILFIIFLVGFGMVANQIFAKWQQKQPSVLGIEQQSKQLTQKLQIDPQQLIDAVSNSAQGISNQTIKSTTQTITDVATKSATTISDVIFDNTIGKLLDQVKNLPQPEREKIKKEICQ
ncbi:MAG: hypothetical protein Q7R95_09370 [bacterium]|nr:hypothetical protein [bacterium]